MPAALLCLIVAMTDGDTLKARCEVDLGMQTVTVRLAEIDAPEKGQAFGVRSKRQLAVLCFHRQAEIHPTNVGLLSENSGRSCRRRAPLESVGTKEATTS